MRSSPPTSRGASRSSRSHLGPERAADLLELGLEGELAEAPVVAGDLLPQRGQRRLAGGVDEQRGDVVEELVADGARDRPVAQLLAGVEDLLHPHVLDARRRAGAAGSRRGRRGRRGGRSAGRRPCPRAPAAARAGASPRTPPRPPGARRPGGRCRRSAGGARSSRRGRRSGAAAPGRASSGWRRRPPCGWGRCRGSAPGPPRARRRRARRTRAPRPAPRRSDVGSTTS